MTPDQRAAVLAHLRNLVTYDEREGEDSDLPAFRAAIALLALDGERDRALGADVASYISDHPDTLTDRDASDVRYLLDLIWTHLRTEQP